MEKLFLTKIEGFEKKGKCFAGNSFFADFFSLGVTRTSQIINSLIKKGYISAKYERKGKQIVKRLLTIKCKNLFKKVYEPIKESVRTPLGKCRDSNTVSNIYNNTYFSIDEKQHNIYLKAYPSIDVLSEYDKILAWLISNPKKRYKNYSRFINSWLGRCKSTKPDIYKDAEPEIDYRGKP